MINKLSFTALFVVFAVALSLTACSGEDGTLYNDIMTMLGFDMNDYENEAAVRFLDDGDEVYEKIRGIVSILIYDSAHISTFETTREAAAGNIDAILNYMLKSSYSAYSGNAELLKAAETAYPQYHITTLIPKGDFESYVYRYFGGDSSVQHSSSARFTFLSKVNAYTTTGQPADSNVVVTVTGCVETSHTYRADITLSQNGESVDYKSMIMKRDDGTLYMKYLRLAETSDENK